MTTNEIARQATWSVLETEILNITEWMAEVHDIHVADDNVIRKALITYGEEQYRQGQTDNERKVRNALYPRYQDGNT